jgi:hypothetical protein
MNCAEFQRILPEVIEESRTAEQEAHLRSCHTCSNLISELIAISEEAQLLQASEEPSPNLAWLAPVAAAFLVAFGVITYQRGARPQTVQQPSATPLSQANLNRPNAEDQLLLDALATHSPAMRAAYETNLRNVNAYIHDAEDQANADPNDEEARQSLMNAYQEKAMVYEMALNSSLP